MSTDEKSVNKDVNQKGRHRSPSYPILTANDAITKIRQVYQRDKRAFTTFPAILEHLGYSTKGKRSGTSGRVVSALRQYGLLDERDNQFRVSDLAFKILMLPEESEERVALVKEVALKPPLFRKILAYYKGEIPSDAAIKSHLIFNEKFNPDSVDQFIRVFRETINLANPSPEDYTAGEESEESELPFSGGTQAVQQQQQPVSKAQGVPLIYQTEQKPLFQYNVPLSIQRDVNAHLVITGTSLKKRDLDVLAKKVKDLLDAFEEEEEPEPQQLQTPSSSASSGGLSEEKPKTYSEHDTDRYLNGSMDKGPPGYKSESD